MSAVNVDRSMDPAAADAADLAAQVRDAGEAFDRAQDELLRGCWAWAEPAEQNRPRAKPAEEEKGEEQDEDAGAQVVADVAARDAAAERAREVTALLLRLAQPARERLAGRRLPLEQLVARVEQWRARCGLVGPVDAGAEPGLGANAGSTSGGDMSGLELPPLPSLGQGAGSAGAALEAAWSVYVPALRVELRCQEEALGGDATGGSGGSGEAASSHPPGPAGPGTELLSSPLPRLTTSGAEALAAATERRVALSGAVLEALDAAEVEVESIGRQLLVAADQLSGRCLRQAEATLVKLREEEGVWDMHCARATALQRRIDAFFEARVRACKRDGVGAEH